MDHTFLDGKIYYQLKFRFLNTHEEETYLVHNILKAIDFVSELLSLSSNEIL